MQNANLPQQASRPSKDLANREMLAAHIPDSRRMPGLEASGQAAEEQGSKAPDMPPLQRSAEPEAAGGSTIERAAQRLDWSIVFGRHDNGPHGLAGTPKQQPQSDPAPASRVRFGRAEATRLPLLYRLCLGSVVVAAAAGIAIFFITHSAEEKAAAESASAQTSHPTLSLGGMAMAPSVAGAVQLPTLEGPVPTAAPAPAVAELEPKIRPGIPPSVSSLGGPAQSTARTPSNMPEPKVVVAPAAPGLEATSTITSPAPRNPLVGPALSAAEIAALLARADWLFATGDIDAARLLFERAANAGEARAAVRLAETFDPTFLQQAHLREVRGDAGMAALWYRRALDLGATRVAGRLKALETKQGR